MPLLTYITLFSRLLHMYDITYFCIVTGISLVMSSQAALVSSLRSGFIATAVTDGIMPVEVVLPDGISPHDYILRPSDAKQIKKADIVLWIGPEMETFLIDPVSILPPERRIILSSLPSIVPFLYKNRKEYFENKVSNCYTIDFYNNYSNHYSKYDMHLLAFAYYCMTCSTSNT